MTNNERNAPTMGLYQVHDKEANLVLGPIMRAKNQVPAVRAFHSALADDKSDLYNYPEQFQLLCIGVQNEDTGVIQPITPIAVATGAEWQQQQERLRQRLTVEN